MFIMNAGIFFSALVLLILSIQSSCTHTLYIRIYIYTYNRWLQEGEKERVRTCYMMMMVVVVTRRDYVFLINMVQMFFKFFLFDNTQ